jgi:hypothetical protein
MVQRSGGRASERRHRQRLDIVRRAGTAQEAVDGNRHGRALRQGDQARRAELVHRDGEGEHCPHEHRPGDDRQVDLTQAQIDRAHRRQHAAHDQR